VGVRVNPRIPSKIDVKYIPSIHPWIQNNWVLYPGIDADPSQTGNSSD